MRHCLHLAAIAAIVAAAAPSSLARVQDPVLGLDLVAYARDAGNGFEVCTFSELTATRATVLTGVEFLPLTLAGEVRKDRVRPGLAHAETFGAGAARVALPSGDMLYRVQRSGATELLLVPLGATPRVLVSRLDGAGPGLAGALHVAPDGARAALATESGDVVVVELVPPFAVLEPTSALAPLALDAASLRVSSAALWFVAAGRLHRAPLGGSAAPVDLGLPEAVDPELVLAADGGAVVAAAVEVGGNAERRLFLVRASGAPVALGRASFERISPAGLQHPLGPFVAVAPDASVVAWRELSGGDHELMLEFVGGTGGAQEMTEGHVFANYIDSIGVLAFANPTTLCFFAGDRHAGQFVHDTRLAASDMYAIDLTDPAAPVFSNITRTSTQESPPFQLTGDLSFAGATVGPGARRIHLDETDGRGRHGEGSFDVMGGAPGGPNFMRHERHLARPADVLATPHGVLLASIPREETPLFAMNPGEVECSGDPLEAPRVRIQVTDKDDPLDSGARVYFDGEVALGETFEAESLAAGQDHLPGDVRVHVLALDDTPLQFVKFKADCGKPLEELDRFGAVALLGTVAEDAPLDGRQDHCLSGSRPALVVLRYLGGDCGATQHLQDPSKVRCSGAAGSASPVRVLATDREDPAHTGARVWFDGTVALGDELLLDAACGGEARLQSDTWVHVLDAGGALLHSVRFHTSCSQPLVVGDRFGAFELADCVLQEPPAPGDLCADGRPRSMLFSYVGLGCDPIELGPRLRFVPTASLLPPTPFGDLEPGSDGYGPTVEYWFPRGVTLEPLTPSRDARWFGFVAQPTAGLATAFVLQSGHGLLLPVARAAEFGGHLGFSSSGALLLPRVDGLGQVLELHAPGVPPLLVDAGAYSFLPLLR